MRTKTNASINSMIAANPATFDQASKSEKKNDDKKRPPKHPVANAISHPIDVAAVAIGVSVGEVYNLLRRGELHARKSGKRTLIEDEELRRYVKSLPAWKPADADAA